MAKKQISDFEKFEETSSFLARAEGAIKNSFTWMHDSPKFKDYAPEDLQKEVNKFLTYLKNYEVEKLRPKAIKPEGEFFDEKELHQKIQKSTGYLWELTELNEEEMDDEGFCIENIVHGFGYNPDKIKVFSLYRDSKSRGELWLLRLVLMPGCAYISWDAGRSCGSTEVHNTMEDLMKEFEKL